MNGEHDFNIRQIQRALRILHKNGEDIPIVYEDGIFGEETERGIIAFQAQNGLSPNGIVDYDTWVLLMEKANGYIRKNGFLQAMLIAIAERYSGIDGVVLNGINDEATRNAIKYIHKCEADEKCDGALTRKTWNSVARLFNAI